MQAKYKQRGIPNDVMLLIIDHSGIVYKQAVVATPHTEINIKDQAVVENNYSFTVASPISKVFQISDINNLGY